MKNPRVLFLLAISFWVSSVGLFFAGSMNESLSILKWVALPDAAFGALLTALIAFRSAPR